MTNLASPCRCCRFWVGRATYRFALTGPLQGHHLPTGKRTGPRHQLESRCLSIHLHCEVFEAINQGLYAIIEIASTDNASGEIAPQKQDIERAEKRKFFAHQRYQPIPVLPVYVGGGLGQGEPFRRGAAAPNPSTPPSPRTTRSLSSSPAISPA
jgi:hypothetical protein